MVNLSPWQFSSDTVGAIIDRPRSNCEAIVAVFEENKKMIALGDAILFQNCRATNSLPYRVLRRLFHISTLL